MLEFLLPPNFKSFVNASDFLSIVDVIKYMNDISRSLETNGTVGKILIYVYTIVFLFSLLKVSSV